MNEAKLPVSDFAWGNPEQYTADHIAGMADNANTGCFLEVDCEFPTALTTR
jgi:hypothetical protein